MHKRLTKALGVAALSIVTMGLFIPQAAADRADNLPSGLDCERLHCNNNTNDTYEVNYNAFCIDPDTHKPKGVVENHELVSPHENRTMFPSCNGGIGVDADYESATVYSLPPLKPGTGSAH
jgi:hypothetical protein